MPPLYVASNTPGAGKTALCTALAKRLQLEGHRVALVKPLQLRDATQPDADVAVFRQALGNEAVPHDPHLTSQEQLAQGLPKDALRQASHLASSAKAVIAEGLSGLSTDAVGQASAALAEAMDASVLLVVQYQPGLKPQDIAPAQALFGERLLGVVINGVTRYRLGEVQRSLAPAMKQAGLPLLGWVPEDRSLLGSTVSKVADHLGARFLLNGEGSQGLVDHFLIGGLMMDWGPTYFGRLPHKAVIVRGNRPDIAMAALQAEAGLSCLILTGGQEPIQYVQHEAREEGVPVLLVDEDTQATAARLESLMAAARFNHPLKLERYLELLSAHVDLGPVRSVLLPGA